jgi:hypothetical protein
MPTPIAGAADVAADVTAPEAMSRSTTRARWLVAWVALGGCGPDPECGDCFEQGFRVDLSSVPSSTKPQPAVLFSGWRNGYCQNDVICTGDPDVLLGELDPGPLDWSCTDQDEELVAFVKGHAPTVQPVVSSGDGMTMNLKDAKQLRVTIWIVDGVVPNSDALVDASLAKGTYADFATGFDLQFDVKPFPALRLDEVPGLDVSASCAFAPEISEMINNPRGFDQDRINVYYVEKFADAAGDPAGRTCSDPPVSRQDIILVNGAVTSSPAVLAHEIGHTLGLLRYAPLPGGGSAPYGHVNELKLDPYLSHENLMKSGGSFVNQITVGQIYRMHFDELSWLWHNQIPADGYPRTCQDNPVEGGSCPPLTLLPRGWR